MSSINIKRAVINIRGNTTVYSPIVEVVVNAIDAIDCTGRPDGRVLIRIKRSTDMKIDGSIPEVIGFEIEDNGVGFTDEHRDSFDTLYSDLKIEEGGKGFGRFVCLKYFGDLRVLSVFCDGGNFRERRFSMGKDNDIVVGEVVSDSTEQESRTVVSLAPLKDGVKIEKKLVTIGRNLAERLLPYFLTSDYSCPSIVLIDEAGDEKTELCLNDFFENELATSIQEVPLDNAEFTLESTALPETFAVRVFKIYYPGSHRSKLALVAHKREVAGSSIQAYVPEFADEFFEKAEDGQADSGRNYIVKAYVFGSYLDRHVELERSGFEFQMEPDLTYPIGQRQIESEAASIAKQAAMEDIVLRSEKRTARIQKYVDESAPWHKSVLAKADLSDMPIDPSAEQIESRLQREKFLQETKIRDDVKELLTTATESEMQEKANEIVERVHATSKNDLAHYIALRRSILDILDRSLKVDEDGEYSSEGVVHDIIFPRKGDTESTPFEEHNLWIVDERLNFTYYLSSDKPLDGPSSERPDLVAYDRRVVFRGDNIATNPITVLELKKPQRDDFANPSAKDDPIAQVIRYVNDIRQGKYKTPEGRDVRVTDTTPFYAYVVCDVSKKVSDWLENVKSFTAMPDRLGWFWWHTNIPLYVEVLAWEKVLGDALMRNRVFFHKLGIAP